MDMIEGHVRRKEGWEEHPPGPGCSGGAAPRRQRSPASTAAAARAPEGLLDGSPHRTVKSMTSATGAPISADRPVRIRASTSMVWRGFSSSTCGSISGDTAR